MCVVTRPIGCWKHFIQNLLITIRNIDVINQLLSLNKSAIKKKNNKNFIPIQEEAWQLFITCILNYIL